MDTDDIVEHDVLEPDRPLLVQVDKYVVGMPLSTPITPFSYVIASVHSYL